MVAQSLCLLSDSNVPNEVGEELVDVPRRSHALAGGSCDRRPTLLRLVWRGRLTALLEFEVELGRNRGLEDWFEGHRVFFERVA